MDYTNRFDGKGEIYAKARPKYASGLFDYMKSSLRIAEGSVFADVGSGTGIFTEQLIGSGYRVFAIEPNGDMRKKAEEKLSGNKNFVSISGTADDTKLPDRSVDCVSAAQAFHWLDADSFRIECGRILKPRGRVMIVYNVRDENAACTKALAELRKKYNSEFRGFSNGMNKEKCMAFFDGKCDIFRADNTLVYDRRGYTDRVLSSSYSLKEGDAGYDDYLKDIDEIFDKFASGGLIEVPTYTIAFIGEIKTDR